MLVLLLGLILSDAMGQNKNFKLGPVYFAAAATLAIEFNDNVSNSATNPKSDLIVSPGLSLDSAWNISEVNQLSFDLGIGYRKYLNNSELDSGSNFLDITPDTRLAFNVFIDTLTLEFYDAFNYSIEATDAFARDAQGNVITNVAQYGRFENQVGVMLAWDLNDLKINGELSRLDLFAQDAAFGFTERNTHTLSASALFLFAPNLTAGLLGSAKMTDYRENFQNDGITYSLGPQFTWQPTALIGVSGSFGYTLSQFDIGGGNGDTSDSNSIFWNLNIKHRAARYYSHSLGFSRSTRFGFVSNTTEISRVRYRAEWRMARAITFFGGVGYEFHNDSGGLSAEEFDRHVFDIATKYAHSSQVSSQIFYTFSTKDSSLSSRSFNRNRIVFSLQYDF